MGQIQFIQVTPEQLQQAIIDGVKPLIDELKKDFQPKEPEKYISGKRLAEKLDVDLSTTHNWAKRGIVKKHGIGGKVFYKLSEIEAAIIELKIKKQ